MLSIEEVIRLINEELSNERLEKLARDAHELTIQHFGKTMELYAPIYLSNSCVNACRYCGFNRNSDIKRMTLTADEVLQEAHHLMGLGHRHILLVAGEDPRAVSVNFLETIASHLKGHAAKLLIETQPFDEPSYRRLLAVGIDGVTLYQETYHEKTYKEMHPSGPKSDFRSRMEAISNAGRAGMRFLGIGALLGLHDWRFEAVALIDHARQLQKQFWKSQINISFPRIRDCASDFHMPSPVSDRELVQMIILLRLALPEAGLVISTREKPGLRNHLIRLGITQMSAGSVTSPGGYTKNDHTGEQFHIEDTRSPASIAEMIATSGYQPVWKNWEKI
jgi:2-iminoacetate synthase